MRSPLQTGCDLVAIKAALDNNTLLPLNLLGFDSTHLPQSEAEIERAYRQKSAYCHPDKVSGDPTKTDAAVFVFQTLQNAKENLINQLRQSSSSSSSAQNNTSPSPSEQQQETRRNAGYETMSDGLKKASHETTQRTSYKYAADKEVFLVHTTLGITTQKNFDLINEIYGRGNRKVFDDQVRDFLLPTPKKEQGKDYDDPNTRYDWHHFDHLDFSGCNVQKWGEHAMAVLHGSLQTTNQQYSFRFAKFDNANFSGVKIQDTGRNFRGASFVGANLSNTTLYQVQDAVFDAKSLSSSPAHIQLENNENFFVKHKGALLNVTPDFLLFEILAAYKGPAVDLRNLQNPSRFGSSMHHITDLFSAAYHIKFFAPEITVQQKNAWATACECALDKIAI